LISSGAVFKLYKVVRLRKIKKKEEVSRVRGHFFLQFAITLEPTRIAHAAKKF
jgi:hypothetical protein